MESLSVLIGTGIRASLASQASQALVVSDASRAARGAGPEEQRRVRPKPAAVKSQQQSRASSSQEPSARTYIFLCPAAVKSPVMDAARAARGAAAKRERLSLSWRAARGAAVSLRESGCLSPRERLSLSERAALSPRERLSLRYTIYEIYLLAAQRERLGSPWFNPQPPAPRAAACRAGKGIYPPTGTPISP